MIALGSFKKVAGTALAARDDHDQISAVQSTLPRESCFLCQARRSGSAMTGSVLPDSPESSTHCQDYARPGAFHRPR